MKINKTICLVLGLCTFLFVFTTQSLAVQYARPVADLLTGTWEARPSSSTPLWDAVDEPVADDNDYIVTTTRDDIAELELGSVATPDAGLITLRIRARSSSRFNAIRVVLLSSGSVILDTYINLSRFGFVTTAIDVTNPILDYSSMEVRLTFKEGSRGGTGEVSWIELEIPDPPPVADPVLSSPTSASIGQNSATLGATIDDTGTSNVTEQGVVWSTTPGPTTGINEGSCSETAGAPYSTGAFTCAATGLTPDTPYYFAGYAINSSGTGYSGQGILTTLDIDRIGHNWDVGPMLSTPITMIDCVTCHALHDGVVPTGDEVFTACEKCHVAGGEADSMSDIANHVVTRESDGATVVVDCGKCHSVHKNELISDDTHPGGMTSRNRSYIRVDMTKYYSTAKTNTIYHNNIDGVPIPGDQPVTYSYGNETNSPDTNNGTCQSCHTDTKYHKNDGSALPHKKERRCTGCHTHRYQGGNNNAFMGRGHANDDINVLNAANCSSMACHYTPDEDPVKEIHRENCSTCHIDPLGDGPLWEPWQTIFDDLQALPTPRGATCEDCHFRLDETDASSKRRTKAEGHHNFARTVPPSRVGDGQAQQGLCINCHTANVGQANTSRAQGTLEMPENLPCNLCHVYWPNNGYTQNGNGQVEIYGLSFDPNGAEWGQRATATVLATHTISKATNPPISDYSACFACHGASTFNGSVRPSPQVVPFHGLGTPYSSTNDVAGNTSTGGDIDDLINAYSGDSNGNQTSGSGQPVHVFPFHPGFKALNWLAGDVGWQEYRFYGFPGKNRRWHENDWNAGVQTRGNSTYGNGTSFEVPWDNYADTSPPTLPVQIDVNIGGRKGTQNVDVVIPTVPLTLP